ncbi:MAG: putative peptidoglycan biosynthesis protein MurJ [Syntrophorhabdus sp. PtaU1.Bin153]|nr:MAG: putative peptidoglycan biosynthesis protein MurJ [Syntrophorhabdus sp. PtaU1.Bin153]
MEQTLSDAPSPHGTTKDIIRKGSIITIITLISRPLGYVREAIQAYLFGATFLVDAFIVAFNFPELIQTLFFSGATSAFLIPVCVRYMKNRNDYSTIYSTFINLAIILTASLSLFFFAFSNGIVGLIAPGFSPEAKVITKLLFIIMIPVIALHTILSVIKAFLNAKEHFAAPEMSGILWNLAFILSAVTLRDKFGIYSLAIGVTAGSFLQIVMQVPYLRRFDIRYRPVLSLKHPAIGEAKRLFTGALIATSIVPINSFVGRVIASYLPQGEVASLAYAFRIFILPFSLFAVPIYTVVFSKLSKLYHEKDWKGMHSHVDSSVVLLAVTLIPCTILLCTTGDAVIKILYERGAFTVKETLMTNRALFGYSIGLLFYALSISFVRVFNSMHDMRTPAIVGVSSIIINAVLASLLMVPFKNLGISLATSIVSLYNFGMLYVLLKKRTRYTLKRATVREITRSLLAGIILLFAIFLVRREVTESPWPLICIATALTALIYGVFFRTYYVGLLKRSH